MSAFTPPVIPPPSQQQGTEGNHGKTLELGVFVDQAAHDLFLPYLGTTQALTRFILAYINGVSNCMGGKKGELKGNEEGKGRMLMWEIWKNVSQVRKRAEEVTQACNISQRYLWYIPTTITTPPHTPPRVLFEFLC